MASRLGFDNDAGDELDIEQQGVTAFAGRSFGGDWSVRAGGGAVFGGTLTHDQMGEFEMGTGVVASVAAARRWTFGGDGRWFADGSGTFGAGTLTTTAPDGTETRYTSVDLRFGVTAGRVFAERFSPYVLARAFGGPVFWEIAGESTVGTDKTHVQLGAGIAITLPANLTAVIDVSALGERSASAGVSLRL